MRMGKHVREMLLESEEEKPEGRVFESAERMDFKALCTMERRFCLPVGEEVSCGSSSSSS